MSTAVIWIVSVLGMICVSGATCDSDSTNEVNNGGEAEASVAPFTDIDILHRLDVVPCTLTAPLQANRGVQTTSFVLYNWFAFNHVCHLSQSSTHVQHSFNFLNNLNKAIEPRKTADGKYRPFAYERHFIKCPQNKICSLEMIEMNLQGRIKIGGKDICLDYLLLENPVANTKIELCGQEKQTNYIFNETLYITFRSGYSTELEDGFKINIKANSINAVSEEEECLQQRSALVQLQQDLIEEGVEEKKKQYIPERAKEMLERFYNLYKKGALAYSIDSYHYILRVAALSERSCNQEIAAIGQDVLSLFSSEMVDQARAVVSNGY